MFTQKFRVSEIPSIIKGVIKPELTEDEFISDILIDSRRVFKV